MLFAEGSSSASSAWRSVSRSPDFTLSVDSSSATRSPSSVTSVGVIVTTNPCRPAASGCSSRVRYAVITFATLAIGTGVEDPEVPKPPTPSTSTAAWPSRGQAIAGALPASRTRAGSVRWTISGGVLSVAPLQTIATASRTTSSAPSAHVRGCRSDRCRSIGRVALATAARR